MLHKIDKNLLNVNILSFQPQSVIVYVQNFITAKIILQRKFKILGEYPFISALALSANHQEIFSLASNGNILYIASVTCAKTLSYTSKKFINIHNLHDSGITGKNIRIAIIDTGCYPHIDLVLGQNRIIKFIDLINAKTYPYDDNGHGTFVTGVLAGNGLHSSAKFSGVAKNSELIIIKALNSEGQTQAFKVLEAMQWIYDNHKKYNIKVVCMSFGSAPLAKNDPLSLGANSLWDSGIVVVSAAGNDGPKPSTIKSPGSSSKIITVGAVDTIKSTIQMAKFSSRGPIFNTIKPDLVAPGVEITSLANNKSFYTKMSGTSVSAPFVAGVVALILQTNPNLTPNQIKAILLNSSTPLPFSVNDCGAGLLNAKNAINLI